MKKTICLIVLSVLVISLILSGCISSSFEDSSNITENEIDLVSEEESTDNSQISAVSVEESEDESSHIDVGSDDGFEEVFVYDAFEYTLTNDVAKLEKYKGTDEELILPDELDGYTIAAISENAFADAVSLKKLTVGDTVVNIASGALSGCTSLELLCLGSSVAVFDPLDLGNCKNLAEISVSAANTSFSTAKGVLYNADKTLLLFCPRALVEESINLPTGLLKIEPYAFAECIGIEHVQVPLGCVLSEFTFFHCTSLKSVSLTGGIEKIPQKCFFGCVRLKEISIPEGVTEINRLAFFGCVALTKISLPSSITSIDADILKCCSALKAINVKNEYSLNWYNETGKSFIQ